VAESTWAARPAGRLVNTPQYLSGTHSV